MRAASISPAGIVAASSLSLLVLTSCTSTPVVQPYNYVPETETSPYVHAVMSDEPVAYWRLASRDGDFVPGPVDHGAGNDDGALRLEEGESVVLAGMNEFDKYAFTVELWLKAPRGRFLSYTSEAQPEAFVLDYDATAESLGVTILGERVETGVELDDQWRLLSVSWDGADGETVVGIDGVAQLTGALPSEAPLVGGGRFELRDRGIAHASWHDRVLHVSRVLGRTEGQNSGVSSPHGRGSSPTVRLAPQVGPDGAHSIAYRPDGSILASASASGHSVTLWEADSLRVIWTQRAADTSVTSLAFSPDGRYLALGLKDGRIDFLDVAMGHRLTRVKIESTPTALAFHPDGSLLAIGSTTGSISLLSTKDWRLVRSIDVHEDTISSLAFSPRGRLLASGSLDTNIVLTKTDRFERATNLSGHTDTVTDLAFGPDGVRVVSSGADGTIRVWDANHHTEIGPAILSDHEDEVTSIALSPDGRTLALGTLHSTNVVLRDLETGEQVKSFMGDTYVSALEFSPDGRVLATGREGHITGGPVSAVRLLEFVDGKENKREGMESDVFGTVAFSSDGGKLVSPSRQGVVYLWDLYRAKLARTVDHDWTVSSAIFLAGDQRVASADWVDTVKIWKADTGRVLQTFRANQGWIYELAQSADGRTLATGSRNGTVRVWDTSTWSPLKTLRGHEGPIWALAFARNSNLLLSGGRGMKIRVWNPATGEEVQTLDNGSNDPDRSSYTYYANVASLAVDPAGKLLAAGSWQRIALWDLDHWQKIETLDGLRGSIGALDFSPDSATLASGGEELRLWDVRTGRTITRFNPSGTVDSLSYRPDGRMLATGTDTGTITLWDVEDGSSVRFRAADDDWLIYTDDGYFSASPDGADLVHAVQGLRTFGIDQLALKNNRPDIILKRLGSDNHELIAHYEAQWRKRLKKAGLTEADLGDDVDLPGARILRARELDEKPGVAEIIFELRDTVGLKRYQVYVDNVPLFADGGIEISGERVQLRHEVQLTDGANKIEVSALNTRGQESLRADRTLDYSDPEKGDLYYVGFGVSDYAHDEVPDLTYAHKDAEDLEALLARADETFDEVHAHSFTNGEVTVEAIAAAQAILDATEPPDTVVLFVAGHGMYDQAEAPTYYYLTHDAKLDDLENTAASFESIESLLDGIPARNKLFLIDTCQSGESTEPVQLRVTGDGSRGLKARAIERGVLLSTGLTRKKPRKYLLERDRFIYRDLRRRTGAIVISSSLGSEYSWESKRYENGAFTEAIVEALTSGEVDGNADGDVSTTELRRYVRRRVPELTDDKQHPTVDRDNIHRKFALPALSQE